MLVLLACLLTLFSANVFAVDYKFDTAVRGNLGLMDTLFFTSTTGGTDNALRVINYGITLNFDTIFVFESPRAYGFALGIVLGFNQFDQQFKYGSYYSEGAYNSDISDVAPDYSVPMQAINTGLMFRFFPVNSLSIGIGPIFHFIVNSGSFILDSYFSGNQDALLDGLIGLVVPEVAFELTSTRFFGNFGIDFSVNVGALLYSGALGTPSIIMNFGSAFGFRYRFSPY